MLLHRPHHLNISAVSRRGQSQQVSSLIQYTFWQAKINTLRFVCQLFYPQSHLPLTLASSRSLLHLSLSEKFVFLQFTNYLNHPGKMKGRNSPSCHPRTEASYARSSLAEEPGVVLQLHLLHLFLVC